MTSTFDSTTSEEIREQRHELRAAQAQREEDLQVLKAQLDYAKRELAELEVSAELDGRDNIIAIEEKDATITRIERSIRAKTLAIKNQEHAGHALAERQAAAEWRELQEAERKILDATPAADARVGEAAFAVLQAVSAREALWRRLHATQVLMHQLHDRSGRGSRRVVRAYEAPRIDIDAIVGAALSWARSTNHEVNMETWTFIESDEKGAQR